MSVRVSRRTLRHAGVALMSVAAAVVSLAPGSSSGAKAPTVAAEVSLATPVPATPAPTPVPVFRPVRMELPTLGVTAPVIPVGIDPDGAMGTPKTAHEVAWWDGVDVGAGNALLAGHKDWRRRPGSFYAIGTLKPGDPIRVLGETGVLEFRVEWVKQVPGDTAGEELLGDAGRPVVTLITCGGEFDRRIRHYKDRVVVRGILA